jgi:antitoxin component YwqK of YwqJK toxin-antitoxin module
VDHPKRPDNFTGLWIERHGVNARTEQQYVGGIANGAYRSILENDVVHREGFKKDGLWHGTVIVRNSEGEILDKTEFVEGTGVYRIFNSAGQITDEVPLVPGKPHGVVRCWRSGKLVMTHYDRGVCNAGRSQRGCS